MGTMVGMALIYLAPPILVLSTPWHGSLMAALLAGFAWILMAVAYGPTLKDYGRAGWSGMFVLPAAALLYTAMTLSSAWRHARGRGGRWKDRHYAVPTT